MSLSPAKFPQRRKWRRRDVEQIVEHRYLREHQQDLNASTNGYFSFIDNWDSNWKAYIDNKPVEIELLFGTFKSVKVGPGKHIIRFMYQPGFLTSIEKIL